jgi:hypothetical protein
MTGKTARRLALLMNFEQNVNSAYRADIPQLVLFPDRRINLMQIIVALNVTLISVMRGRDTAGATSQHTEKRRDHVLCENLCGSCETVGYGLGEWMSCTTV